ncbi:VWA-like domain-containing protein [Thiohalorhabdus methylotrophus]|uniref:VWA-like domain-containing protein n=1 Tax=Thiohalorhabdus methylotrophus TaxID=3242694 RepID=A0ABV4TXF4_9GAMM
MTQMSAQRMGQRSLLSAENHPYQEAMHRVREFVMGSTRDTKSGMTLPRFGQFSLMAQRVPVYLYDHPDITARFPTAFTDGQYIFFNVDFFRSMLADERAGGGESVIPVLLHEMMHMMLNHTKGRHGGQASPHIVNMAHDVVINGMLLDAFERRMTFGTYFLGNGDDIPGGLGTSDQERSKYRGKTELQVLKALLADMPEPPSGKGGQTGRRAPRGGGQGTGGGGSGDSEREEAESGEGGAGEVPESSGEEVSAEGTGSGDPESPQPGVGPDGSEGGDLTDPLELRHTLENAGLKGVADKAGLPRNPQEAEAQAQELAAKMAQEAAKARNLAKEAERQGGQMAGAHISDYLGTRVDVLHEPVIGWRDSLQETVLGGEGGTDYTDDLPGDLYYVEPGDMGMAEPVYDGTVVSHSPARASLVVVDTSGSVGTAMLRDFFSEVAGMSREMGEGGLNREIIVLSADTVIRGEAQRIQPGDFETLLEEGMEAYGRGGTSLADCMNMAVELARQEGWPVDGLVYFTDWCDRVPELGRLHPRLPPRVTFIVPEGHKHEQGMKAARPYAEICEIRPGVEVDFDQPTGDRGRPPGAAP